MRKFTPVLALCAAAALSGCPKEEELADSQASPAPEATATPEASPAAPPAPGAMGPPGPSGAGAQSGGSGKTVTTASGLKYQEIKVGTGATAVAGKHVSVHYTGTLTDGTKFDSSRDRGTPIDFPLGAGQVIQGWDEGISGMKVGGRRKLTIPPAIAYGPEGRPPVIPPNATLLFDVELMGVE